MSQIINLWELNEAEQDELWVSSMCPKCGSKILDSVITVDYTSFLCSRCDILYICE